MAYYIGDLNVCTSIRTLFQRFFSPLNWHKFEFKIISGAINFYFVCCLSLVIQDALFLCTCLIVSPLFFFIRKYNQIQQNRISIIFTFTLTLFTEKAFVKCAKYFFLSFSRFNQKKLNSLLVISLWFWSIRNLFRPWKFLTLLLFWTFFT